MWHVFVVCVIVCTGAFAAQPREQSLFTAFAEKYNKVYASQTEYQQRAAIFEENLAYAAELNTAAGSSIYGVTKFMDLTREEFSSQVLMPKGLIQPRYQQFSDLPQDDVPSSFDWGTKGAVTPVKDQGQCGSCWAFSATEAIESQWFLAGNTLPVLAPQQIVDCDKTDGGCNGGDTTSAYEYVISAGGQDTEASYPYKAKDEKCAFKPGSIGAKIKSWTYITKNKNETEMAAKLVTSGPLSICVDASTWQYYNGGVVQSKCADSLDHCVMITGFRDETVNGQAVPIWTIRNSWGANWGEKGFIWVERGKNLCGVADEVTIPIV